MNYIEQLEAKVADQAAKMADVHNELSALLVYLDSPKFTGQPDSNGTDRNFVNAAEMRQRIADIRLMTL